MYAGIKVAQSFGIDLVVGSLMTRDPEQASRENPQLLDGALTPPVQLYPVVDHIADKVCATETLYGGFPSSRARDLVDLVVLARTHRVDISALRVAIASERQHRGLPHLPIFEVPEGFSTGYAKPAEETSHCREMPYADAVALARSLVEPAMAPAGGPARSWDHIAAS